MSGGIGFPQRDQWQNLQDIIDTVPNIVDYLYNNPPGPYLTAFTVGISPWVPPEFTNWFEEQLSWSTGVALFDLSHHMTELFLKGPGSLELIARLAVNNVTRFVGRRSAQLVFCNENGFVIGDVVAYLLDDSTIELVGFESAINWVQFHAEQSGIEFTRDDLTPLNPRQARKRYRFQLEGPQSSRMLEKLIGQAVKVGFFEAQDMKIGDHDVLVLGHGMAGRGFELSGPYDEYHEVLSMLLEVGREFGLVRVGRRAYRTTPVVRGWFPSPLPAVYTGEGMRAYRRWLPTSSYEAASSLGGSFYSPNVEDYYMTPWDLGYGKLIHWEHDFMGRDALRELSRRPQRRLVTLVWHPDDVVRVFRSLFEVWPRYKIIELPLLIYSRWHYDTVLDKSGKGIGISSYVAYVANYRAVLSLASIDADFAVPGSEVIVVWGEPHQGSRKPNVEAHAQILVRATVAPAPYWKQSLDVGSPGKGAEK